jgi:hypothetical protein
MAAQKCSQRCGHGEGQHEVRGRQLAFKLVGEPLIGLALLAHRTVAVAAAAGSDMRLAAVLALIHDRSCRRAAAVDDRRDDPCVRRWHRVAELRPIRRPMPAEDLLDGTHVTDPP